MTTHGTRHRKDMEFIEMHPKISDNGDRFDMSDTDSEIVTMFV